MYKEFETSSNSMLSKSNSTEIQLHQQIIGLKKNLADERKKLKTYQRDMKVSVAEFAAEFLNKHNMIFVSHDIVEQLSEIRKEALKLQKKSAQKVFEGHTE